MREEYLITLKFMKSIDVEFNYMVTPDRGVLDLS